MATKSPFLTNTFQNFKPTDRTRRSLDVSRNLTESQRDNYLKSLSGNEQVWILQQLGLWKGKDEK